MGEAKRRKLAGTYPTLDGKRPERRPAAPKRRYFGPVVVTLSGYGQPRPTEYVVMFDGVGFQPGTVYRRRTVRKRDKAGKEVARHQNIRVTDPELIEVARAKAGSWLKRMAA